MSIACLARPTSQPSMPFMISFSRETRRRAFSCSFTRGRGRSTSRLIAWRRRDAGVRRPASCPLWVISGHRVKSASCPLYPQKQTLGKRIGMSAKCQKRTYAVCAGLQCAPGCSVRRALHARDGYIRSHVGVHLSVPKKWSKVCADRGVQFELCSCLQCSEGRGERTCFEGSGGLSDPALENQWQG